MLSYLGGFFAIEVLYLGSLEDDDVRAARQFDPRLHFDHLPLSAGVSRDQVGSAVAAWLRTRPIPGRLFIDKTELAYLQGLFPPSVFRVLDTHDIVSLRNDSARRVTGSGDDALDEAQEIALLRAFDVVLCIQAEEAAWVTDRIGAGPVLLAMHPVTVKPFALRPQVRCVGLLASGWHANVDGLRWFVTKVWPRLAGRGVELRVFGRVCQHFESRRADVRLCGTVKSTGDAYGQMDIAINPVRYGAGLKIKTVEAMAHGLPVVATGEGASGLRSLDGHALLMADQPEAFAAALGRIADDPGLRTRLARGASEFVAEHLNPERCFAPVRDALLLAGGRGNDR